MSQLRLSNFGLYVAKSRISGLGVFAARNFRKGDVVETAPVLKLRQPDEVLGNYVLTNNRLCLGYGAVYNHSSEPNVRQRCEDTSCVFTALTDIKIDDELCIDYGNDWWQSKGRLPLSSRPPNDEN
jgi:SET domain-containing protein